MWAVYHTTTGALVSLAASEASLAAPLPSGLAAFDAGDVTGRQWDSVTRTFGGAAGATRPMMSKGDWMARVGLSFETALNMVRLDPAADLQTRATLMTLDAMLMRVSEVNVTDPRTVIGAGIIADVLVAVGVLPADGRAAFVATLLAPAPVSA